MDSNSESSQSTAQADNRNVLGQSSNLAQGGSSITNIDSRADNRASYQTDASTQIDSRSSYQADNRSSYQADNSTTTTTNYALDGDVANRAIGSASDNLAASLGFGTSALNLGGKSISAASDNLTASLGFGTGALTKAFSFAGDALNSLTKGQDRALDSVADSNSMVKDAYADAKGRGAMTDNITIGALALAALVAFAAIKK